MATSPHPTPRRRWLLLVAPSVVALVLVASWGMSARRGAAIQATASLPITGTMVMAGSGDEGAFTGTVTSLIVTAENGQLLLSGVIAGNGELADGTVAVGDVAFTTPVQPTVSGADAATPAGDGTDTQPDGACDLLTLSLEPFAVGKDAELRDGRITFNLADAPGDVALNQVLLCGLGGLLVTAADDPGTPIPGADPTSTPLPSAQTPEGGTVDSVTAAIRDTLNQIVLAAGVGSPKIGPVKPPQPIQTSVGDPATAFGIEETPTPIPSA